MTKPGERRVVLIVEVRQRLSRRQNECKGSSDPCGEIGGRSDNCPLRPCDRGRSLDLSIVRVTYNQAICQ